MVDTVVIEVCRYNTCCTVVCRVLYWRKRVNFVTDRQNYNSSRVLSCRSSYIHAALGNTLYFTSSFYDWPALFFGFILKIVKNISVCSFFGNRTDCSRFKCLSFSKNNLGKRMCLTLVFIGKVKVDIRLFIPFESKECLKRNVKAHFVKFVSASRTYFIRHVTASTASKFLNVFRIKFVIVAFWAQIMRT